MWLFPIRLIAIASLCFLADSVKALVFTMPQRKHDMQERHIWYRGRHRFLLASVNRYLPKTGQTLSAIDLGGGAGGWVSYLAKNRPEEFVPLGLADSLWLFNSSRDGVATYGTTLLNRTYATAHA